MNPHSQDTYTQAYNKWVQNQTADNMADLVSTFMPTINAELQQYPGSRTLLRAKAKALTVKAIQSYNPLSSTNLNTWVVTNLKQLSRYGKKLRTIHSSEDNIRNAAEYHKVMAQLEDDYGRKPTDEELQDATGWSTKELARIKATAVSTVSQSQTQTMSDPNADPEDPSTEYMNQLPFKQEAVYMSLNDQDKQIYDFKTGSHGQPQLSGVEIAQRLKVSPAYISQRGTEIGEKISTLGV